MMLFQLGVLFAQVRRQPPPAQPDPAATAGILMCYGVLILIGIIVHIFFLLTLSKCLAQCAPRNRSMEPGLVWLNLIPLFNLVWMFITIIKISESLRNDYHDRGLRSDDPDFGQMTGILYMVFSFFCGLVALIFFIMYWVKIANFKNQLMTSGRRGYIDDDEDDFDRPRRSRRRRDDDYDDDRRRRDDDDS